jgi:hypothetical protein
MKLHRMGTLKSFLVKDIFYAASQKNGITNYQLPRPSVPHVNEKYYRERLTWKVDTTKSEAQAEGSRAIFAARFSP